MPPPKKTAGAQPGPSNLGPPGPKPESYADREEQRAALQLYRTPRIGPVTYYKLLKLFGSAKTALEHLPELTAGRKTGAPYPQKLAEKELAQLHELGGRLLLCTDPDWPPLLRFEDAPPLLSLLGSPHLLEKPAVAIVGARDATVNGLRLARILAADLAAQGWLVVSGLARGIDAAAHEGALLDGTAAVVAGGADVPYPEENKELREKIIATGLLLSEVRLGQPPQARHFPRRNRIISGLARGTLVVEAAHGSGSLLTANHASEQGREVLAVPGSPLDPRARGCNLLLRQGAALVETARDVVAALESPAHDAETQALGEWQSALIRGSASALPPADEREKLRDEIISLLGAGAVLVEDLILESGAGTRAVQIVLLALELEGRLQRLPGDAVSLLHDIQALPKEIA